MVFVVITSQRLVTICEILLNGFGPFEVGVIPDGRKESVVRDVQRGKLRGFPLSLLLVSRVFLVLTLAPLLFRLTLSGRLAALGCDHHGLRGCLDIVL